MFLLGDFGQQMDIGDLNDGIAGMRSQLLRNERLDRDQARSIEQLQQENRELKLYLATLVRLLVSKGVLKPEEVETVVRAIETEK